MDTSVYDKPHENPDEHVPFVGDDFDDGELNELAFEEEMHYAAANTLGYFFDPDFDGTIQEYYDNTLPMPKTATEIIAEVLGDVDEFTIAQNKAEVLAMVHKAMDCSEDGKLCFLVGASPTHLITSQRTAGSVFIIF